MTNKQIIEKISNQVAKQLLSIEGIEEVVDLEITANENGGNADMKGKVKEMMFGCKITVKYKGNFPSFEHSITLEYDDISEDEVNQERATLIEQTTATTLIGLQKAIQEAKL